MRAPRYQLYGRSARNRDVEVPDQPERLSGILAALQGQDINVEFIYVLVQKF
jgi:hypothetical protein